MNRHPDEDAETLTPKEEEELHQLSKEYINALEFDDKERAKELKDAIRDLTTIQLDDKGFWV